MKQLLVVIILSLLCYEGFAQRVIPSQGNKVDKKRLYFLVHDEKLKYFTLEDGEDDKEPVGEERSFALKKRYNNLYFKWLNPIKYTYEWKDTTYNDERDEAVKEFVNILTSPFRSAGLNMDIAESSKALSKSNPAAAPAGSTGIYVPSPSGFNNVDLTLLFILLRDKQNTLTPKEIEEISNLSKELEKLDKKITNSISDEIGKHFQTLIGIKDPDQVELAVQLVNSDLSKYETSFNEIEKLRSTISQSNTALSISDVLLNSYTKKIVSDFLDEVSKGVNTDRDLVTKIKPVLNLLQESIEDESEDQEGYFGIREVSFDEGKVLKTTVSITEFEYKATTNELEKKDVVIKNELSFREYDFINVSVSTGLFYANTELTNYGLSNSDDSFVVKQDTIERSTAVTALFLNFGIEEGSRMISPLAQIGVDPTKTRPFILIGGGLSIPLAKFAITAGGIWTWNQTLDKLQPGQKVSATTDLEKDIKYNFEMEPKGWYIGVQYMF
ncbi:hypothetical protein ACFS7Z_08500 [Pontibacter toksunensis]|uniref:Uncharacterized protein n=1 Tax=Pontibacter toksunensis TaxID=1332631 RepID=A0ABW6BRL4_9BACT